MKLVTVKGMIVSTIEITTNTYDTYITYNMIH